MSSREYPQYPIPGVSVIAIDGDKVLLIQRGKEPRRGEWSIPGGALEMGETVREAAVREFREECGGLVELGGLVDAADILVRDPDGRIRFQYALFDFWGTWRGGELRAGSDVMAARWVRQAELAEYRLPDETQKVIEKAFALAKGNKHI